MAKKLTKNQKDEISLSFIKGKTIEILSKEFNCTKLTITNNLKKSIGELKYKEFLKKNKNSKDKKITKNIKTKKDLNLDTSNKELPNIKNSNEDLNQLDYFPESSFMEITPLEYKIENSPRKDLSSVPISEIDFPKIVYMIVDKKIELEIKLLKDYPEWSFLPIDDLNRKTIEIYFDLKIAKRFCNKDKKVIKVPNTDVFRIAAPLLISRGISRIVSAEKLISL